MRHRVHISYSKDEAHAKYHLELALLPSIFNIQIFIIYLINLLTYNIILAMLTFTKLILKFIVSTNTKI